MPTDGNSLMLYTPFGQSRATLFFTSRALGHFVPGEVSAGSAEAGVSRPSGPGTRAGWWLRSGARTGPAE